MKKIFVLLFISTLFLAGCDSYLDRQPDDALTSDSIWEKRNTTMQYLWNVYSWIPNDADPASNNDAMDANVSDETSASFPNSRFGRYMFETQTPDDTFTGSKYRNMYYGIREAGIFMENVDRCPELTADQKKQYKAEARFLRAYYYFYIMKNYGPTFFNGEDSYGLLAEDINKVDRTDWQTLVTWVCGQLDQAAADLPTSVDAVSELGRATKGMALAIKARLLLYSARPLFNGQVYINEDGTMTESHMYDDVKDLHGKHLFNIKYDESRWADAAKAAKDVIDLGTYALVNSSTKADNRERALENFSILFVDDLTNNEIIFPFMRGGATWRNRAFPQWMIDGVDGWASICPTQKLVDAFAMSNGVYPVKTEYWDTKDYAHGKNVDLANEAHVDSKAGYSESGSVNMKNPLLAVAVPEQAAERVTPNQFADREARFYRNVGWSGMQWVAGNANVKTDLEYYSNGQNAWPSANNVPPTGYLALKWYSPKINPLQSWGTITWPIVRLANVYLDYIEALNEYDPTNADIEKYWNEIRNRAGVPDIFTVYPEIKGDKNLQRKYIRRERMVELCFECHRYADIRTWMTAESARSGYTIGCNVKAGNDNIDGAYWQRREIGLEQYGYGETYVYGPRKFTKKSYLEPFETAEVNRVPALRNSQNLGW